MNEPIVDSLCHVINNMPLDKESEEELLTELLNQSCHTDLEGFVLSNLSYLDAMEFSQSHDDFVPDAIEHLDSIDELPLHIPSTADLAHHLAYTDTEQGTALLNELLSYRELGRI